MTLSNHTKILESKFRGNIAEIIAKEDYLKHGYKIIPQTIGADFIAVKKTKGRTYKEFVEVKTGNSRLSKIQKKKRIEVKKKGFHYTIYHINQAFLDYHLSQGDSRNEM